MIVVERQGDVRVARLDAPPHNALDEALADAIEGALDDAVSSGSRVLHLRSDATSFCGGAHPSRLDAWLREGADALAADAARFDALFRRLESAPLVVMAEIGGPALGAGLGLALACDLRCAADDARFGVPEAKVGTLPAGGTIARLARVAGSRAARRLLLTGELPSGETAFALGLADWIVPKSELAAFAAAMATRVATLSPLALAQAKALLAPAPVPDLTGEEASLRALAASVPDRQRFSTFVATLARAADTPRAIDHAGRSGM